MQEHVIPFKVRYPNHTRTLLLNALNNKPNVVLDNNLNITIQRYEEKVIPNSSDDLEKLYNNSYITTIALCVDKVPVLKSSIAIDRTSSHSTDTNMWMLVDTTISPLNNRTIVRYINYFLKPHMQLIKINRKLFLRYKDIHKFNILHNITISNVHTIKTLDCIKTSFSSSLYTEYRYMFVELQRDGLFRHYANIEPAYCSYCSSQAQLLFDDIVNYESASLNIHALSHMFEHLKNLKLTNGMYYSFVHILKNFGYLPCNSIPTWTEVEHDRNLMKSIFNSIFSLLIPS